MSHSQTCKLNELYRVITLMTSNNVLERVKEVVGGKTVKDVLKEAGNDV